ncbi:GntR family transcriptional regulator [uncultured Sphaerochaeta sp.]|uniref:GntR family transcriptional regulator n=1 Tax=uncultured Sphaerochaeta sp. TaxID=886478 RepID=UPI002A0A84CC|nr:GntR family transcriptional regulator [uncultured Sphaerochaeta sp.]
MHEEKNTSLIETIYQTLRFKILQGTLNNGEKLSENTLANDFHCSRTPVREALKRLEQNGFIVIIPHSGSYIKASTINDYQQLTEVRTYLEALAMRLDCDNLVNTSELESILNQMDTIWENDQHDMQSFTSLHYQFHLKLVQLAKNTLLDQMYGRLNLNEIALLSFQEINKAGFKKTQAEHRKLVQAIQDGNSKDGEKFMISHLWRKRERFRAEALQA